MLNFDDSRAPVAPKKKHKKRSIILICSIVAFVIIGLGVGAYFVFGMSHNPIPAVVRSQVKFDLFYPSKLPNGWKLDKNSFTASSQLVVYKLKNGNNTIVVNTQAKPKDLDLNYFYTKGLSGAVKFTTPLGDAAVGKSSGQLIGSLTSTNSWILATSSNSKSVSSDTLRSILSSFKE